MNYLPTYRLNANYLKTLDRKRPIPIRKLFAGEQLLLNRSLDSGAPLLTVGLPLAKDEKNRVTHIIIADINLYALQKAFKKGGVKDVFLIDNQGTVIAHTDESQVMLASNVKSLEVVQKALTTALAKGTMKYFDKLKKQFKISAYNKTSAFNLTVVAEAPESIILEPAKLMQVEVYRITGLVLFGSLVFIVLFSWTLTNPIEKLVTLTMQIAKGNFNITAMSVVRSNDEVGKLAASFDAMVEGLKERDKVKTLFDKFHGSAIAQELLSSDVVTTSGGRKKVAVFFSDIRDFTSISEKLSAEDVVKMLNEYFSLMVSVIHKNHGVVDKFIGDAIMAVWGAPKSSGQDAFFATKASLEMRMALNSLNEQRIARGEFPIKIGMGVHVGDAIAGNIGSDEKLEYTVIGDTVNMASRIESSTKAFGSDLVVSEEVAAQITGRFVLEEAGSIEAKGKSKPIKLFKVPGYIDERGTTHLARTPYSDYTPEGADKVKVVDIL